MTGVDVGKEKVKKICDLLRKETLEPAMQEVEAMLVAAKEKAAQIISEARAEATQLKEEAASQIVKERNVFHSSLAQACKQALESLKQDIEAKLFDQTLARTLSKLTEEPRVLAELISAVAKGIEKEGIDVSFTAYIPKTVTPRAVNQLLARDIVERLKEKGVAVGSLSGGIEVVLRDENLVIDLSDQALAELVATYIRKDFRQMLFNCST